jgi:hypothetical protein
MDGIALHHRAVVVVDAVARDHCLASRSGCIGWRGWFGWLNTMTFAGRRHFLPGPVTYFLPNHEIHGQDDKKNSQCHSNFSQGVCHSMILAIESFCCICRRNEQKKPKQTEGALENFVFQRPWGGAGLERQECTTIIFEKSKFVANKFRDDSRMFRYGTCTQNQRQKERPSSELDGLLSTVSS